MYKADFKIVIMMQKILVNEFNYVILNMINDQSLSYNYGYTMVFLDSSLVKNGITLNLSFSDMREFERMNEERAYTILHQMIKNQLE